MVKGNQNFVKIESVHSTAQCIGDEYFWMSFSRTENGGVRGQ